MEQPMLEAGLKDAEIWVIHACMITLPMTGQFEPAVIF